ncbi:hypothetical protein M7I_7621 [Glarea lozoyensis 74030]|uniref:Uncharacterized protein n=1 Tax=Glarea lozoyensis (strain ATCC 74030 / MF5533) TaxID=1104152 RepID=H0EXT2_GLAL7|nr:hypothetical protein M7I_7621 [Glarea lozoyensis 74030]
MEGATLTQRNGPKAPAAPQKVEKDNTEYSKSHPAGAVKHSPVVQVLRLLGVVFYFFFTCLSFIQVLCQGHQDLIRCGFFSSQRTLYMTALLRTRVSKKDILVTSYIRSARYTFKVAHRHQ